MCHAVKRLFGTCGSGFSRAAAALEAQQRCEHLPYSLLVQTESAEDFDTDKDTWEEAQLGDMKGEHPFDISAVLVVGDGSYKWGRYEAWAESKEDAHLLLLER